MHQASLKAFFDLLATAPPEEIRRMPNIAAVYRDVFPIQAFGDDSAYVERQRETLRQRLETIPEDTRHAADLLALALRNAGHLEAAGAFYSLDVHSASSLLDAIAIAENRKGFESVSDPALAQLWRCYALLQARALLTSKVAAEI